jgi:hypothetical protein
MTNRDLQKKYNLNKNDFWEKEIKNKKKEVVKTIWIISHDACEKIAVLENIELENIQVLNSEINFVRFLITMKKEKRKVVSVGEADINNCGTYMPYFGCMAEKRGIDRCILKLIDAYSYGIYSEVEADSFSRVEKKEPEKEVNFFQYKNLNIEKLQEFLKELQKNQHPQIAEVAEFLRKKILERG